MQNAAFEIVCDHANASCFMIPENSMAMKVTYELLSLIHDYCCNMAIDMALSKQSWKWIWPA